MQITPEKPNMREVTDDEWAEHLAGYRTYQTEGIKRLNYIIMYSRLSGHGGYPNPGYVIAETHYLPDGSRHYFIRGDKNVSNQGTSPAGPQGVG